MLHTRLVALLAVALLGLVGCGDDEAGTAPQPSPAGDEVADAAVFAQPGEDAPTAADEGITVHGVGRIAGEPDVLRISIGVETERPEVQDALDDNNAAAERVLAALQEAGVADEDIQTSEFSIHPRIDHRRDEAPELRGYAVRNLVEVALRDLDRAGQVLAAAVDAGGSAARVRGVRFALEDNSDLLEAAREAAFADARTKAEHYARLAGRELGPLVAMTETGADAPISLHADTDDAGERASAPPIRPGEQDTFVRVRATWALE